MKITGPTKGNHDVISVHNSYRRHTGWPKHLAHFLYAL